jgi:tetratricopeptide (TPR) repeat protein
MAGRYGMSFAAKMIQEGKYAEAIEEATRAVARDEDDPAPLVERASAYAWLERYPEAVKDLEAAIALDETAGVLETGVLETDVVDDAYFSALLGAAKLEARSSLPAATQTLARYQTILPGGRHLADAAAWPDRLRAASAGT